MQWVGSFYLIQHLFICTKFPTLQNSHAFFPLDFNCLPSLQRETTHKWLYYTPVPISTMFCLSKFHVLRLARKASNEEKCLSMLPTTELGKRVYVSWMSTCENGDLVLDGRVKSHFHVRIIFLSRKCKKKVLTIFYICNYSLLLYSYSMNYV